MGGAAGAARIWFTKEATLSGPPPQLVPPIVLCWHVGMLRGTGSDFSVCLAWCGQRVLGPWLVHVRSCACLHAATAWLTNAA
jgi:hypothetical protein